MFLNHIQYKRLNHVKQKIRQSPKIQSQEQGSNSSKRHNQVIIAEENVSLQSHARCNHFIAKWGLLSERNSAIDCPVQRSDKMVKRWNKIGEIIFSFFYVIFEKQKKIRPKNVNKIMKTDKNHFISIWKTNSHSMLNELY